MGTTTPSSSAPAVPHARRDALVGALVAIGAIGGCVMLLTGTGAPPVSDLEPLGLHDWTLPALWLFGSVAVPWSVVAVLAWRRHPATPVAVLVAAALLVVELAVQIPFVGLNPMQPVLAAVAVLLGWGAWRDRGAAR